MSKAIPKLAEEKQALWDAPKMRQCLRCNTKFRSEWSGERICANCKSTKAWQVGVPMKPRPARGQIKSS